MKVALWGDDPRPLVSARKRPVSLDVETTGLDFASDLLGVAMAWVGDDGAEKSCYLTRTERGQLGLETHLLPQFNALPLILAVMERHTTVMHNEAFDYRMLWKYTKTDPGADAHDTKHMASLVASQERRTLDALYTKYVGPTEAWYKAAKAGRGNLEKRDPATVAKYAQADALFTLRLYEKLDVFVRGEGQVGKSLYAHDREYARLVMRMIAKGLTLDFEWLHARRVSNAQRQVELERELKRNGLSKPGSSESEAAFLYRTLGLDYALVPLGKKRNSAFPDGVPSVAVEHLELYRSHPTVQLLIELRQLSKDRSSWIEPCLSEGAFDGKIHSVLDPFGTVSFRMSSSRFNVQAVPMKPKGRLTPGFAGMFKADDPSEELYQSDQSQAEVRLAAGITGESALAAALATTDPYVTMSERAWGTPDRREDAKRAMLASLYEVGPDRFSETYNVPIESAREILDSIRRAYPRVKQRSRTLARLVEIQHFVPLFTGRKLWFGPGDESYKALNQQIQGSVSEVIRIAMVDIERKHAGLMNLQVHDSIVAQLPKKAKERKEALRFIETTMIEAVPPELVNRTSPPVVIKVKSELWQS